MANILNIIFLGLVLISLSTCTTLPNSKKHSVPTWVNQPHINYPSDNFFAGIGNGKTIEDAQNKARASLAKSIQVSITARTDILNKTSVASFIDENKKSTELATQTKEISWQVDTYVKQIIKGIEIANTWNENPHSFYALAILDKEKYLGVLLNTIKQLNTKIDEMMLSYEQEDSVFAKINLLQQALDVIQQRDIQAEQTNLFSPSDTTAYSWTEEKIKRYQSKLFSNFHIQTIYKTQDSFDLLDMITSALNDKGIQTKKPYNYLLLADIVIKKPIYKNKLYWQSATVNFKFNTLLGRVTLKNIKWDIKASSVESHSVAQDRLITKVNSAIKARLVNELFKN